MKKTLLISHFLDIVFSDIFLLSHFSFYLDSETDFNDIGADPKFYNPK